MQDPKSEDAAKQHRQRHVQRFVKEVLGCGCPDSVFERIEASPALEPSPAGPVTEGLCIGERLLVHFWRVDDVQVLASELPLLLEAGRSERDRRALNRCRLVVVTSQVGEVREAVESLMNDVRHSLDDRLHVHVVPPEDVDGLR